MALSVDRYRTIQDLWQACLAAFGDDREAMRSQPFSVAVPDGLQEREKTKKRLLQLLGAGFYTMEVPGDEPGEKIKVVQPKMAFQIPGEPSVHLNDPDIQGIVNAVAKTLPHPEDPHFADAINARVHGVIELLALMIRFHAQGRDAGATLRNALYLGMDAKDRRPEGVLAIPLSSLDYERRSQELTSRRQIIELNLKAATELPKLAEDNRTLYSTATTKCDSLNKGAKLTIVYRQFHFLAEKFGTHPFLVGKQWHSILQGIRDLESAEALDTLADELTLAENSQALQQAIVKFCQATSKIAQ